MRGVDSAIVAGQLSGNGAHDGRRARCAGRGAARGVSWAVSGAAAAAAPLAVPRLDRGCCGRWGRARDPTGAAWRAQVLIPAPYWVSYPEMARMAGAEAVIVETALEEGFLLAPEQLAAALSPSARVLILCSPSNPTGTVYDEARLRVRPGGARRQRTALLGCATLRGARPACGPLC